MELTGREDIDVPIEQAFIMLTDVEVYERSALRRGADVTRLDTLHHAGVGAEWQISFIFRGKAREVHLEMTGYDRPNEIAMKAKIGGLETDVKIELVALSRTKTRIQFWCGMRAKTLSSRLLLQSLKLARGNLTNRVSKRLAHMREDFEDRYAQSA
ncbi:SRPBCC family protein [Shimia sp. R9_3]|uniref:SRPBCC family protein n=1 Tax=Shimia sp. R9_3 TaxID=2821113 RepID=UPI001ADBF359|nr:SRPBCC family protein [Shimia sp. R9_3]MBO9402308.1 SRPBCC family protein [Shimia sp. R9_3]